MGANGSQLLDPALQRRVTVADLRAGHYRNLGRRGSAGAAELLRATRETRAASEAERLLVALLRMPGPTGSRCGFRVDRYKLDCAPVHLVRPDRPAGRGTR